MRKTINTITFLFFIWLVIDAFDIPSVLLNFLLVGAIPGTTATLSPNVMLTLITLFVFVVVYATLARRYASLRRLRHNLTHPLTWRSHLPSRRYSRI